MSHLSVIIPTLNEAARLPGLFDALQAQTRSPDEIIVADAGSQDGTQELALAHGVRVVPGGLPGPGRNAGARAATGDLFLFLDADVLPPPNFIADMLREFAESGYAVATCLMEPLEDDPANRILIEATNLFLQVIQYFVPHAPGFCILVDRQVHAAIGGFDEVVKMAEDHDYVQRAAKQGRFGVLTGVRIPVSMRRLEEEGLPKLALKYLWTELYALTGKPIETMPFEYKFGEHAPAGSASVSEWKIIDVARLREQLGKFENPLQRLSSAGLNYLEQLITRDSPESLRERVRLQLDSPDLDSLGHYLRQRLELIRQARRSLSETLTLPYKESISLLEGNWLRSRISKATKAPEQAEDS